ncbi:hypothetical protein AMECASPLE_033823 [Ameca splendens]|uniref:Uncharacterized protein n=1 Tax=Ameca splendens TaxID=208324 RepID=A0ABV0Y7L8_9TELE
MQRGVMLIETFPLCCSSSNSPAPFNHDYDALTVASEHDLLLMLLLSKMKNDLSSYQSYDRVLCAHGHGYGDIFHLLLRNGVGFLQPERERSRGRVRHWKPNWGTPLYVRTKFSAAGCQVRRCASAGARTPIHPRDAHTEHICELLG